MKLCRSLPERKRRGFRGIASGLSALLLVTGCGAKYLNPDPANRMYRMAELNCRQIGTEFRCDMPPGSVILEDFSIVGLGLYQAREDAISACIENLTDCRNACDPDLRD